jgi:PIN domain nuclease of toxin-antitoxin system
MKLLLDTHVVLWWLDDPTKLTEAARDSIAELANEALVSAAVAWEIAIKTGLGKLTAPDDLEAAIQACRFETLPITVAHAMAIQALPMHHRDPFDRLLVAQAVVEGATIVARDPNIGLYGVPVITA